MTIRTARSRISGEYLFAFAIIQTSQEKEAPEIPVRFSVLIVVAPNDFSELQDFLIKGKYVDESYWLAYPDHLSYFNKASMTNLLKANNFSVEAVVADNPIDCNLLNANSNYVKDRTKGKETHYFRVRLDNFLASIDQDKLLDLYTLYADMGLGRDLSYFCRVSK